MGKNDYFTDETEQAIIRYNESDNRAEKNRIYLEHIHEPFSKIVDGMLDRYVFEYINLPLEDMKQDALTHLYDKLYMFKPESGNAFSYFSVACKNYFVMENNRAYNKLKRSRELDTVDIERSVVNEIHRNDTVQILSDFMDEYIDYIQDNLYLIFRDDTDIKIADSLMELFDNRTLLEHYNKKALYLMIRERVGVDANQISSVINKLKEFYEIMFPNYLKTGDIVPSGSFF